MVVVAAGMNYQFLPAPDAKPVFAFFYRKYKGGWSLNSTLLNCGGGGPLSSPSFILVAAAAYAVLYIFAN